MIDEKQTAQMLEESLDKSSEFADKLAYWMHQRQRMPNQIWFLKQFILALGYDRVCYILGRAVEIGKQSAEIK